MCYSFDEFDFNIFLFLNQLLNYLLFLRDIFQKHLAFEFLHCSTSFFHRQGADAPLANGLFNLIILLYFLDHFQIILNFFPFIFIDSHIPLVFLGKFPFLERGDFLFNLAKSTFLVIYSPIF